MDEGKGGMQEKVRCRTGEMLEWRDEGKGKERGRNGGMQERKDVGKERVRL